MTYSQKTVKLAKITLILSMLLLFWIIALKCNMPAPISDTRAMNEGTTLAERFERYLSYKTFSSSLKDTVVNILLTLPIGMLLPFIFTKRPYLLSCLLSFLIAVVPFSPSASRFFRSSAVSACSPTSTSLTTPSAVFSVFSRISFCARSSGKSPSTRFFLPDRRHQPRPRLCDGEYHCSRRALYLTPSARQETYTRNITKPLLNLIILQKRRSSILAAVCLYSSPQANTNRPQDLARGRCFVIGKYQRCKTRSRISAVLP